MPADTRIPMSYQGIELDNPANAMALAERAGEAKNRNALSKIELEEAQKGPNPRDQFVNETKQIGDFIKAQLPMLDETSADDFFNALNEQGGAAGKMAAESWFKNPAPAGEKLKGLTGRLNPKEQPRPMSEYERGMLEWRNRQDQGNGGQGGLQPAANGGTPVDPATIPAKLPVPALKMEQEALDNSRVAKTIVSDLDKFVSQIDTGALDLGLISNLSNKARNNMGMSTEESRNLVTLESGLQKLRNDSLRLNKGPQTDGDAERAWQELLDNINDPQVVRQRLEEIKALNANAAEWHFQQANNVRANYGAPQLTQMPQVQSPNAGGTRQQLSPQDQQAWLWAQDNPQTPQAAAIIERLNKKAGM